MANLRILKGWGIPDGQATPEKVYKEAIAAQYNNFSEFSLKKDVWRFTERFQTRPQQIEVGGEVDRPQTFEIDDLVPNTQLEERLYRHRCAEAWAMAVP